MQRDILHLQFPSFLLQVLMGNKGNFIDRPAVMVGLDAASSRIVSLNPRSISEGARRGMLLAEARRRIPKLEVFTPRHDLFIRSSHQIAEFLGRRSPLVEPGEGGFYMDLSGTGKLFGPASDVSGKLIHECGERFGMIASAGIGICKLVGRTASSVAPAPGLAQVMPSNEAAFLSPFPLRGFFAKDRFMLSRMAELGIEKVGDIDGFKQSELTAAFGANGRKLYELARGIDYSPVVTPEAVPEIEEGENLTEAVNDFDFIRLILSMLSERLGKRLRERKSKSSLIKLMIVYKDGRRAERKSLLTRPTAFDSDIYAKSIKLLDDVLSRRAQLIYIGLRASRMTSGDQLDLFGETEKQEKFYGAIDLIRRKYGDKALQSGAVFEYNANAVSGN